MSANVNVSQVNELYALVSGRGTPVVRYNAAGTIATAWQDRESRRTSARMQAR